jgi:hypothetical protein
MSYPRRISEPMERDHPDAGGSGDGADNDRTAESGLAVGAGHSDRDTSNLSDTGVGLGAGEPNTFEPEEAGPAVEGPTE